MAADFWLAGELELADGATLRFGGDEKDERDLLSQIEFATQNPGGFGEGSFVIPRPEWATRDALLFSPVRIYGPGERTFYEGRCRDISQVDRDSIRLDFEGWAAHLDDDESFRQLYVSRDLTKWEPSSRAQRLGLLGVFNSVYDHTSESDPGSGLPALTITLPATEVNPSGQGWFDAGSGQTISSIYYDYTSLSTSSYNGQLGTASDDVATASDLTADLLTGTNSSGSGTHTPTAAYRYGLVSFYFVGTVGARDQSLTIRRLAVFGDHGLAKVGTAPDEGYLGSQVLEHAITAAAPMLTFDSESIETSSYVFTDLWHESGPVRELIERVTAYGGASGELNDWGVYDDRQFYWRSPGTYGRAWKVRRDQFASPTEDGPSADARFSGVIAAYTDAAGTTKTVGPLASGADYETDSLLDFDENNPAHRVTRRFVRRDVGLTSQEGAVLLGQGLIAEQRAKLRRGSVTITGTAVDEGGAEHPVCAMRAGDRVLIEDEAGVEPATQYVNSTTYSHDSLTVTASLGYTPHRMEIVLAQLAAAVQGL